MVRWAFAAFLLGWLRIAAAGVGVSVAEFYVALEPGGRNEVSFSIYNDEPGSLLVEVSVVDWENTADGVTYLRSPGTLPRSCADWIRISPDLLVLDPNVEGDVTIGLRPPPSARGTYWAAVVVEIAAPAGAVRVRRQFVVKVYATVGRTTPAAAVSSVGLNGWNPIRVTVVLENPGDVLLRSVTGVATVEDRRGEVLMEIPIPAFHVLPGERVERTVRGPWPLRTPGIYLIRAVFDFGVEALVAGQIAVRIDPLDLAPVGGAVGLPADRNGDGFYEDVNGDGRGDRADVEHFRAHLWDPVIQRNARAFDFDNDGRITLSDVEALERRVSGSGE